MAMLSSCTTGLLISRAPAAGPKFSPAGATATPLQLRKQLPPLVVAPAVALRWASCKESRRAPDPFVCHALGDEKGDDRKYNYDIQPSALQNAPKSTSAGKDWNVMGDEDLVILKLRVGESAKGKVDVSTTKDQTHLVIKYTGDTNDNTQASKLNVTLALPPSYDSSKVQPKWFDGWLVILIAKRKHSPTKIDIPEEDGKSTEK